MNMTKINGQRELKSARRVGVPLAASLALALALGCDSQADAGYEGEPLATVDGRVESALSISVGNAEVGVLWLTAESSEQCSDVFDLVCTGEVTVIAEPSACADACGVADCENLEEWEACVEACPDVTNVIADTSPSLCITGGVGQTTPAVGTFPAQFSLDILEPPPAEALIGSATGERLAYGLFVAVDPAGAPWRIDLTLLPDFPDWLLGGSDSHFLLYTPDTISSSSTFGAAFGGELTPGFHLIERFLQVDEGNEIEIVRPAPPGDASEVRLLLDAPENIAWPLPF